MLYCNFSENFNTFPEQGPGATCASTTPTETVASGQMRCIRQSIQRVAKRTHISAPVLGG